MIEVLSLIGVIPIIGIIAACCLYRRQRSGNSQVTTASVAYNRDHYSAILVTIIHSIQLYTRIGTNMDSSFMAQKFNYFLESFIIGDYLINQDGKLF